MKVSLANASVIVKLNITAWSASGKDKSASRDVVRDAHAQQHDVARVYKSLLPTSRTLKDIVSVAGRARQMHYQLTAPWSDNGDRVLPIQLMERYMEVMGRYETEYMQLVTAFIGEYEKDKNGAAFVLGTLFDNDDYPPIPVIRSRFSFNFVIEPLPTSEDFRVDLPQAMGEIIKQEYENAATQRVEAAMKDVWSRVMDTLTHLRDRLTDAGDKPNIFRNSMVDNAKELVELLRYLNVTQDTDLEYARAVLERQLGCVDSDDLRADGALRKHIVDEVTTLLDSFNAFADLDA